MLRPKSILVLLITLIGLTAFGQSDPDHKKAEKLEKRRIVYYWTGRYCNPVGKTEHGFTIKCTGCIVSRKIKLHNKRAVRRINRVYGKNWFQETYGRE